jgi:alginate O-acetyltransferase complex protein AlgI
VTVLQLAVLIALALAAGQVRRGRGVVMLSISTFAVFWLQAAEPFVALRFWLPVATLSITVAAWAITSSPEVRSWRQNWPAVAVLAGVTAIMALGRYLDLGGWLPQGAPPVPMLLLMLGFLLGLVHLLLRWRAAAGIWQAAALSAIVLVFIVLKLPELNRWVVQRAAELRGGSHSDAPAMISWLGFSYLAFRLLHTIRDRQSGRLPPVTLEEYANYAVFFPAFTSGPIDRLERFVGNLRGSLPLSNEDWTFAGGKLVMGLFKKFVLADLLAVISINDVFVLRTRGGGWLWLFVYAYALRIYFDFSGYTDMAIGMGRLLGIRLPENFAAPYLKPNITQFWTSWHMTLTQWFRSYVFNPLTRTLRTKPRRLPAWLIVLTGQVVLMVLVGLWHGITWGFMVWGLWHAAGLFIHNRWSEFMRGHASEWLQAGAGRRLAFGAGVFLTFNFVSLGWLFFTLSSPGMAWLAIRKMFGFA